MFWRERKIHGSFFCYSGGQKDPWIFHSLESTLNKEYFEGWKIDGFFFVPRCHLNRSMDLPTASYKHYFARNSIENEGCDEYWDKGGEQNNRGLCPNEENSKVIGLPSRTRSSAFQTWSSGKTTPTWTLENLRDATEWGCIVTGLVRFTNPVTGRDWHPQRFKENAFRLDFRAYRKIHGSF